MTTTPSAPAPTAPPRSEPAAPAHRHEPAGAGWFTAARRAYAAEAIKLRRPGTTVAMAGLAVLAVLSTVLTFALAKDTPPELGRVPQLALPTLDMLASPGGLVLGFRVGTTFAGLLLLVISAATMATEFGQGTVRVVLLRQPRRLAWLAGRAGVLVSLLALALVGAFVLSAATAVLLAEIRGVPTGQWWTADALREAGKDYANVLVSTVFFALTGTTLGLLIRSTTAAVMVGIVWMFPLEHLVEQAWSDASKWLPGLVFADVGTGGTALTGYQGPLLLGIAYTLVLTVLGVVSFARRDVTA